MATAPSPTTSSRSRAACGQGRSTQRRHERPPRRPRSARHGEVVPRLDSGGGAPHADEQDRKSTRLNSSHLVISYAVFCLKKKTTSEKACTSARRRTSHTVSAPRAHA